MTIIVAYTFNDWAPHPQSRGYTAAMEQRFAIETKITLPGVDYEHDFVKKFCAIARQQLAGVSRVEVVAAHDLMRIEVSFASRTEALVGEGHDPLYGSITDVLRELLGGPEEAAALVL